MEELKQRLLAKSVKIKQCEKRAGQQKFYRELNGKG